MRFLILLAALVAALDQTAPAARPAAQKPANATARRAQFLEMFARAYFPGRTGQVMIVPREGDIITRADPSLPFMHGSPWTYDTQVPLFFVGDSIPAATHAVPATHQDIAPTIAAIIGATMPATVTGRALPITKTPVPVPRAVFLLVLDGMRPDYFERYAPELPTLTALRKKSASFINTRVNYLPTNTGVGHATIATGTDPRVHGITGNNLYDRVHRNRHDIMEEWNPRDLVALTIGDVWQLQTGGRGLVVAQGSSVPAATALGGHGACQLNGARTIHAGYDERSGLWNSNGECYEWPMELRQFDVRSLWPPDGLWMGHKIDSPSGVRRSGLFPRFEADAFIKLVDTHPIGSDEIPDLLLLNFKGADYVGHKHGPDSKELAVALGELDRQLARILKIIDSKTAGEYVMVVTADHGMPSEPVDKGRRHVAPTIVDALHARFDPEGKTLIPYYEPENAQIFVNQERLATLKLTLKDMTSYLESQPFIAAAFSEDEVRTAAAKLAR